MLRTQLIGFVCFGLAVMLLISMNLMACPTSGRWHPGKSGIYGSSGKWGGAASQRQAMETAALCKPWKNK